MLILRIALHVAIFAAALLIFTLGRGVGLALNPAAVTLLWLVAGVDALDRNALVSGQLAETKGALMCPTPGAPGSSGRDVPAQTVECSGHRVTGSHFEAVRNLRESKMGISLCGN